jgi:Domain of unknown function (DUF4377)
MKSQLLLPIALLGLFVSCRLPIITEYTVEVAPQTKKCVWGFGSPQDPNPSYPPEAIMNCIQVRRDSSQPFYHSFDIQGFKFEPGFQYRLRVRHVNPNSGMADDFGYVELAAILEKTPVSN